MQAHLKNTIVDRINAFADKHNRNDIASDERRRADFVNMYALGAILLHAKTILFPAEQAAVFAALSHDYTDRLNYALPFPEVLIEFIDPVPIDSQQLLGIALCQDVIERNKFEKFISETGIEVTGKTELPESSEVHQAIGVYMDGFTKVIWQVNNRKIMFDKDADAKLKNLAIACIGYINCENVTLERQEVDEKINRKRLAKGKKSLDPFYLTKIKGYQYDNGERGAPTGQHVSYRFDVRGHFRRYESGKTVWVKPHQRGLEHELYKPKVYVAE